MWCLYYWLDCVYVGTQTTEMASVKELKKAWKFEVYLLKFNTFMRKKALPIVSYLLEFYDYKNIRCGKILSVKWWTCQTWLNGRHFNYMSASKRLSFYVWMCASMRFFLCCDRTMNVLTQTFHWNNSVVFFPLATLFA